MTQTLALKPLVMKNPHIEVDGVEYDKSCSSVVLTPNVTLATWNGFGGGVISDVGDVTWTLDIIFAQDEVTADSLQAELNDPANRGVQKPFEVRFAGPTSKGYSGTMTLIPVPTGGAKGVVATNTTSFPIVGDPTPIAAGV